MGVCLALFALAFGFAWRRFLLGQRSPFTTDIEFYHHPVTRELMKAWSEWRIPLWTDRVYCGFPFFADSQTAAWYPGTLLIAWLGPHTGYVWFFLLHSMLAAVGTLALVRAHGGTLSAGFAAGLLVPLSGFYVYETQHPNLFAILCWVPAWLALSRAVFLRPAAGSLLLASLPLAMMVFAGTLQVLFGAALLYGLYGLGVLLEARADRDRAALWRGTLAVLASQLLALLLAAIVWLPTFAHFPHSARALGMVYDFAAMGSLHPVELLGVFVDAAEARLGPGRRLGFDGASFYAGVLGLPLALVGLLGRRRLALALGLAALLLGLLGLGRNGGLHPLLYEHVPGAVGVLRGMGRALGPFVVCLALLAGLGLSRVSEPRARWLLVGCLAATLLGHALVLSAGPVRAEGSGFGPVWLLVAALLLALVLGRRPRWLQTGLAALVAADLLAFGVLDDIAAQSPYPPGPKQLVGELRYPALGDVARGRFGGDGQGARVLLLGIGAVNFTFHHGLDGVGGYNPLVGLQYLDFAQLADHGREYPRRPLSGFVHHVRPGQPDSGPFQAASTRFVINPAPLELEGLELLERYPPNAFSGRPVWLYENRRALPRAYLAYRTRRADGHAELVERLGADFDGSRTTVYEGDAAALLGPAEIDAVRLDRVRPELLRAEVSPRHPALLVVTDAWYPGWRAWVDGAPAPVLRVNGHFRGIPLAAGARRVELRFEPTSFRVGAGLSLLGLLVLLVLAGLAARARRAGGDAPTPVTGAAGSA